MIKYGITQRGPALDRALEQEAQHKGWWPFAFTLLEEIERGDASADERLIERLYRALSAGEGVWKITRADRFRLLDEPVEDELARRFAPTDELAVHDLAVSNGVTSLEWYDRLAARWNVRMTASDFFDHLNVIDDPQTGWRCVFDVNGQALQCVGRRFVIPANSPVASRYPVNRLIQAWCRRTVIPRAASRLTEALDRPASSPSTEGFVRVSLFHPRCLQRMREDPAFQLRRHSFFDPLPAAAHVVRVMNALTPHHFSDAQIRLALVETASGVEPGGLFIVGRSIDEQDGRCAATVYERDADRLNPLWDLHEGCEIKSLIAGLPPLAEARDRP